MKLVGKISAGNGRNSIILSAVLRTLRGGRTQYHFRVVDEIAVDGKAIFVSAEMYPIRFNFNGPVALLQKEDI
ncbi:hypothetical protein SDC9_49865 [bioreactor metagenome]|uniref:Uncharacterized protein n=1 Tax=bioreactor metagenome TaxID=1076179 RepID=A0A644WJD3_9ZZZZ